VYENSLERRIRTLTEALTLLLDCACPGFCLGFGSNILFDCACELDERLVGCPPFGLVAALLAKRYILST
jgi:hypothetical protein